MTTKRQPHLLLLLAASFAMFTGSFVLDQAFRWSDPLERITDVIAHIFVGVTWLFFGFLPGLLVHGLYRWRRWQKFRTVAIVFPGIAALVVTVFGLIFSPTTPATRFKLFTGADLPASARELRTHFSPGGLNGEFDDIYYFRCSPTDTNALVRALALQPAHIDDDKALSERSFPSWPDPSVWAGSYLYHGESNNSRSGYYLRTDASREQVYLYIFGM